MAEYNRLQHAQGTSSIVEEALAPIPMDLVPYQAGVNSPAPAVEEDPSPAKSRAVVVYSDRIQRRKDDLKNKRSSAKKISDERKSSAEASRHERRDQIVKEKRG
jgi:hypothetical protein